MITYSLKLEKKRTFSHTPKKGLEPEAKSDTITYQLAIVCM